MGAKPTDLRNIFILSIEHVIAAGDNGVSFNQMIGFLKTENREPKGDFLQYYKVWFFRTFFVDKLHPSVNRDFEWHYSTNPGMLDQNADKMAGITAEASFNYLEYIEINEARDSSKKAKKLAIVAIVISILLAVIQIIETHC